jgi:hypothetical protein
MTNFTILTPDSKFMVNMNSRYTINNPPLSIGTSNPSQNPYQQQDNLTNMYNVRSGGFLVSSIMGGYESRNISKIVFDQSPEIKTELNSQTMGLLKATGINMGIGAAVYGTLSVLRQSSGLISGKQDGKGALANITADLLRGGGAGLGASAVSGLAGVAMKAMGATGTVGTIATVIGGIIGANLGAGLVECTGVRDALLKGFGSTKISPVPVT